MILNNLELEPELEPSLSLARVERKENGFDLMGACEQNTYQTPVLLSLYSIRSNPIFPIFILSVYISLSVYIHEDLRDISICLQPLYSQERKKVYFGPPDQGGC